MDDAIEDYLKSSFPKIRKLKSGERGEVWLAAGKSGRLVILKRIACTGLPYKVLKEGDYPLCPRILHCMEDERETVVVEEYLHGEALLDRIGRKEYLSEQEARSILLQLCEGLAPIHAQGIVHRDIKPSNLILQSGGMIRLIDFDAARTIKEHGDEDTTHLGTKGYAPPEQFGYGQTDARSDIYAIGVTLQTALPKNYRGELSKILAKCTAMDPANRYQSVHSLRRAVLFYARWRKWSKALACLAVLVSVAMLVLWPETEETPTEPAGTMVTDLPETKETNDTPAEKPSVSAETVSPVEHPVEQQEGASLPAGQVTPGEEQESIAPSVPYQEEHSAPSSPSTEFANIETKEQFLELFKDDPEKLKRWSLYDASAAFEGGPEEKIQEAKRNELYTMKRIELNNRVAAFEKQLPETMTQAERGRAIEEYIAKQRRILGIKNWP